MQGHFSRATVLGTITKDFELWTSKAGTAFCRITLVVNTRRKKAGQYVETGMFIDATLFGNDAEVAAKYTCKGSIVLVDGAIELDSYSDKNGVKRQVHRIVANEFRLVGGKRKTATKQEIEYLEKATLTTTEPDWARSNMDNLEPADQEPPF